MEKTCKERAEGARRVGKGCIVPLREGRTISSTTLPTTRRRSREGLELHLLMVALAPIFALSIIKRGPTMRPAGLINRREGRSLACPVPTNI